LAALPAGSAMETKTTPFDVDRMLSELVGELAERNEVLEGLLKEARADVEEVAYQLGNPKRNSAMDRLARIDAALDD
jgi:hypothetical protein